MVRVIAGTDIVFTDSNREWKRCWQNFDPATVVLPSGWQREVGYRPLPIDTIWERDASIPLRDGTIIYGDIFRPKLLEGTQVPAVISYSPYGKTDKGFSNTVNLKVGVARDALSGLESFEGLDPAEWCKRGYAICNIDARGSYESQGDIFIHGKQEGEDVADVVEWIAQQAWSNGGVGMAGNSWLACAQWFAAAEKPPNLKAIAPWEGASDLRRHILSRGGITNAPFLSFVMGSLSVKGRNKCENSLSTLLKSPIWNDYWQDKVAKYNELDLPMYIVGSYSTALHSEGSVKGFNYSPSKSKWLRFHPTQEWHDLYSSEATDDLNRFFDRYLSGKQNDWEATPKVRLSLLRYNAPPIKNRPELAYPPSRVRYQKFYLNGEQNILQSGQVHSSPIKVSYRAQDQEAHFTYKFDEYTELIGFSKVVLYMETDNGDDMDVYVVIRKLDRNNKPLINFNIPLKDLEPGTKEADVENNNIQKYIGPNGCLRASWRDTLHEELGLSSEARKLTSPAEVTLSYAKQEKIVPGQKVKLDIQIWPGGIVFDAGESLRLEIKGNEIILPEIALIKARENPNQGTHTIHTGGDENEASYVLLPLGH